MDELKPCPFCGNCNTIIEYESLVSEDLSITPGQGQWHVVCDARIGGCGGSSGWDMDREVAFHKWNERARYEN